MHALTEAHRVLGPDGLLIDLRPAAVHRRVYHVRGNTSRLLGVTRERFDDERASDRAIHAVVRSGHFEIESEASVPCDRVTASLDSFRSWLAGFEALQDLEPHAWLLRRAERALAQGSPGDRIVVRAPLDLRVLRRRLTQDP